MSRYSRSFDKDGIPRVSLFNFGYMAGYLESLGFCDQGMGGTTGCSFTEIKAWRDMCGYSLTNWEAATLSAMSRSYALEINKSSGKSADSPLEEEEYIG